MGLCYRTLSAPDKRLCSSNVFLSQSVSLSSPQFRSLRAPAPPSEGVASSRKEVDLHILERQIVSQVLDLQS